MKHVHDLIDARLGGELAPDAAEAFDVHVAACPECAAALAAARETWDLLETVAAPVRESAAPGRAWAGIRERTHGHRREQALFGHGPWSKAGVAAAAVAAGLVLGFLAPGQGGSEARADVEGGSSFWIEDDGTAGTGSVWLSVPDGEEQS